MSSSGPARPTATSRDLVSRDGDGRSWEIVGGEIVEKAAPSPEHGSAQFALSGLLFSPFGSSRGGDRTLREPSTARPGTPGGSWLMTEVEVEYASSEVYRHDLVGWRRERSPERPRGRPVTLRPDWVCEILSASNASNDSVKKLRTLHRAGVPHYWLLDPDRLTLTVLRFTQEGYLEAQTATGDETVRAEPFEAVELALGAIFSG